MRVVNDDTDIVDIEENGSDLSGDDVCESDSNSDDEDIMMQSLEQLDTSYDCDFLRHETENDDITKLDEVDMDVSLISEVGRIEFQNVPISTAEGGNIAVTSPARLLPEGYETRYNPNLEHELEQVNEKKVVCSIPQLRKISLFCQNVDCRIVTCKERFVGCVLEIRWQCQAGHCFDWQSSVMVNTLCVNNVHIAASLLFTGNNYTKISLFSKCFSLAFISETTFYKCQKQYLAPQVYSWWISMQEMMFSALGDQPIVVSGDGQMDSPEFLAKNCTYTLMHAELDYVLHVEVVHVRHSRLKGSVMEKVGCERALDFVLKKLNIVELGTDASTQIIKMIGKPKHRVIDIKQKWLQLF